MGKKTNGTAVEPSDKKVHVERKEIVQNLKCDLTHEELLAQGNVMAQAQQDGALAESELASIKKQYQSKVDEFAFIASRAGNLIRNKFEFRHVKCMRVMDYDEGRVTVTRLDTDEVVEDRELTDEERQMALKMEPAE